MSSMLTPKYNSIVLRFPQRFQLFPGHFFNTQGGCCPRYEDDPEGNGQPFFSRPQPPWNHRPNWSGSRVKLFFQREFSWLFVSLNPWSLALSQLYIALDVLQSQNSSSFLQLVFFPSFPLLAWSLSKTEGLFLHHAYLQYHQLKKYVNACRHVLWDILCSVSSNIIGQRFLFRTTVWRIGAEFNKIANGSWQSFLTKRDLEYLCVNSLLKQYRSVPQWLCSIWEEPISLTNAHW